MRHMERVGALKVHRAPAIHGVSGPGRLLVGTGDKKVGVLVVSTVPVEALINPVVDWITPIPAVGLEPSLQRIERDWSIRRQGGCVGFRAHHHAAGYTGARSESSRFAK